jgi:Pup-like protein
MRQRFERVTRNHHPRDSYEAEVETTPSPPTDEHLQQEIERILEVIDEVLQENSGDA